MDVNDAKTSFYALDDFNVRPIVFLQETRHSVTLRKSLTGSWTLIEPVSHITKYHVRTPEAPHGYPAREIRRDSSEGPLLGTVHVKDASGLCQLSFFDGTPNIVMAAPRRKASEALTALQSRGISCIGRTTSYVPNQAHLCRNRWRYPFNI